MARGDRPRLLVRLLLSSYPDAVESSGDGARGDAHSSRLLGRNLELWPEGSYAELERSLLLLRARSHTWRKHVGEVYIGRRLDAQTCDNHQIRANAGKGLGWLVVKMHVLCDGNIYVPATVSENAGLAPAEARAAARPRSARRAA